VKLSVKVVPRASRDALLGWKETVLRVAVAATPERGRANHAVEALLADALDLPRTRVRVVVGHTSPRKMIEVEGLDEVEVRRRLDAVLLAQ
jgi:uncharacterized protein